MDKPLSIYGNCTPEDFFWIASVIGSTIDVKISDLAHCLGVSFDGRDETGDQIVQESFLLWQSKNEADCSRDKLLQCLQQLQGSSAFMNKLRKRYSSYREPQATEESNDSSGILIHLQDPQIPTDHDTRPTLTPPPSNEVESDEAFPPPVPVDEAVGKDSKMLVWGQCTDIRGTPELLTKREVTERIAEMEEKFADLVSDVQLHFESFPKEVIQAMKSYLTSLSTSVREDVSECVFTSQQVEIITYNKLPEIFQWLTINSVWSFLNIYLLEKLVHKFSNSDNLKQRIARFKEEMQNFKHNMKLADFLPAWSGRCPHVPASGFAPIILRVNKDWGDCTLADVARMEGFLESRFLINRFILRFANGHYGSVVIMWLVPAHVIAFLKKRIMAIGTISFNQVEMKFGDNSIVKVSSISIQGPNPCTPIKSRKSQAPNQSQENSKTLLDCGNFDELYATSIRNPKYFWGTLAEQFLQWDQPFQKVMDCNMEKGDIKWFIGGKLNVSVNCVDRHAKEHPDRVALIWEKDEPGEAEKVTYKELLEKVCQIANVLKSKGVKKGDTVAIYMPACPLAVASMLACARIGAVHSVLFSKFSLVPDEERANLLKKRTANAKVIITANTSPLSGKVLPLKESLEVLKSTEIDVQHILVYKRTDAEVPMKSGRDEWLEELMKQQPTECDPESMDSEDDLFVMFTSGATERPPKGIVHSQAGYLLHVAVTHKYYFNYQPGEVFSCTADIGWITGHSYVVYGPLCNGATTVLFDSTALHPSPSRYWELVEKLKVNHFYTTPSMIRKLMSLDKDIPSSLSYDLSSLRVIASVGECLNKEAWTWFHKRLGNCRCHFIDTWWQTELGGIAIAPHPNVKKLKPGFIMKPSFGVVPFLIDKDKVEEPGKEATGKLYLEAPLPGMGRRLTGDGGLEMFRNEYFKHLHGKALYYTSDIAHRDNDGDYQIYSRANDAIRYHGELLNLPIIEGAANASHDSIEETVLVLPKDLKDNAATVEEPLVVVHVLLKGEFTPEVKKQDVTLKIMESIARIAPIKAENLEFRIYPQLQEEDVCMLNKTFSGKTKRQAFRESHLPPWRQDSSDQCVVAW